MAQRVVKAEGPNRRGAESWSTLETSALKLLLYHPQPGPSAQGSSRGGGGASRRY